MGREAFVIVDGHRRKKVATLTGLGRQGCHTRPRTRTTTVTTDSTVLVIEQRHFLGVLEDVPSLARKPRHKGRFTRAGFRCGGRSSLRRQRRAADVTDGIAAAVALTPPAHRSAPRGRVPHHQCRSGHFAAVTRTGSPSRLETTHQGSGVPGALQVRSTPSPRPSSSGASPCRPKRTGGAPRPAHARWKNAKNRVADPRQRLHAHPPARPAWDHAPMITASLRWGHHRPEIDHQLRDPVPPRPGVPGLRLRGQRRRRHLPGGIIWAVLRRVQRPYTST